MQIFTVGSFHPFIDITGNVLRDTFKHYPNPKRMVLSARRKMKRTLMSMLTVSDLFPLWGNLIPNISNDKKKHFNERFRSGVLERGKWVLVLIWMPLSFLLLGDLHFLGLLLTLCFSFSKSCQWDTRPE